MRLAEYYAHQAESEVEAASSAIGKVIRQEHLDRAQVFATLAVAAATYDHKVVVSTADDD